MRSLRLVARPTTKTVLHRRHGVPGRARWRAAWGPGAAVLACRAVGPELARERELARVGGEPMPLEESQNLLTTTAHSWKDFRSGPSLRRRTGSTSRRCDRSSTVIVTGAPRASRVASASRRARGVDPGSRCCRSDGSRRSRRPRTPSVRGATNPARSPPPQSARRPGRSRRARGAASASSPR